MDRRAFFKTAALGFSILGRGAFPLDLLAARQTKPGNYLGRFSTPAKIKDLPAAEQAQFDEFWHVTVEAFTQQAILGNPWDKAAMSHTRYYYDPTSTERVAEGSPILISWGAFPNRLNQFFGEASALPENPYRLGRKAVWELADSGSFTDNAQKKHPFPQVPRKFCPQADWKGPLQEMGPFGPRGWQDEYCEWSVTRNSNGKIKRVDFTCENPEYWYSLWRIDPRRVAELIQEILNFGLPEGSPDAVKVTVEDLQLRDPITGKAVIDPFTGRPAYNPLNRWNTGTESIRGGAKATGGAIHLTCTANTLQTELVNLAAVATILRKDGNQDAHALGCCSQDTVPYRNSDPHIAQLINQTVAFGPTGTLVTIADPVGLYLQMPSFAGYSLPDDPKLPKGASVQDCWHIVRGRESLADPITGQVFPGNFILHAVFQIPHSWIKAGVSFTVGDITVKRDGVATPIQFGAQIVETISMGLFAWHMQAAAQQPPQACVSDAREPRPQALYLMYEDLWNACHATPVKNPTSTPMTLASNAVILPTPMQRGTSGISMVLVCHGIVLGGRGELPIVKVTGADVTINVTKMSEITYAAPGHSFIDKFQLLHLKVDVPRTARLGLKDIQVANFGQTPGDPAAALLYITADKAGG